MIKPAQSIDFRSRYYGKKNELMYEVTTNVANINVSTVLNLL